MYAVEHYATHGVLSGDVPGITEPALIFGLPRPDAPSDDDGILTMREVISLVAPAEMVVLSACNTGLGEESPGEGLTGLARAYMYAGTRTVVASLWSVDDQHTAELMTEFYVQLREGKDKALALALAKRRLRERGGVRAILLGTVRPHR